MSLTQLKLARLERGLTQWAVAREVGISESALSRLETGRRRPRPDLLARLADVLNVPVDQLKSDARTRSE